MQIEITDWMPAPAQATRPLFAIGDVHGMSDHLGAMHDAIGGIIDADRLERPLVARLGDYVDRGPDSFGALERVARGLGRPNVTECNIGGNHDGMLVALLEGDERNMLGMLLLWCGNGSDVFRGNGGHRMLAEMGWTPAQALDNPMAFRAALREALGAERLALLASLRTAIMSGPYLFVHAGVDPLRPIRDFLRTSWRTLPETRDGERNSPAWIREPFLEWTAPFQNDTIVVHGHTISSMPELRPNRIGIDTGANWNGMLTAVEIRDRELRFIMVTPDAN